MSVRHGGLPRLGKVSELWECLIEPVISQSRDVHLFSSAVRREDLKRLQCRNETSTASQWDDPMEEKKRFPVKKPHPHSCLPSLNHPHANLAGSVWHYNKEGRRKKLLCKLLRANLLPKSIKVTRGVGSVKPAHYYILFSSLLPKLRLRWDEGKSRLVIPWVRRCPS